MFFLAFFVILIALALFFVYRRFTTFDRNGFLYETPSFPFGNLKDIRRGTHAAQILQKLYTKFKGKSPVAGVFFFFTPNVMAIDLEVVKDILIRNFDNFRNRGLYFNERDDPLSGHIFAIEDQAWKSMRHKITPTFTSGKMKMMFSTVLDVSNNLVENLRKVSGSEVEIKEILSSFTTDVIGNVAFGLEINASENHDSKFREMGRALFAPENNFFVKALFLTSFRDLGRKLRMKILPEKISEFFLNVVKQNLKHRIDNKIERNDFFDLLVKIYVEGNLNFHELAANCFIFFNAGFESTSSTLTFALFHLAKNLEIQERLRKEVREVLKKHEGKISYESVQDMKYLEMVIEETLRFSGPGALILRKASSDYKVPKTDLVIKQGTLVIIPVYAIHNDPDLYPQPEKFDPERFTEVNKVERHSMAYIPFGDGSRNCIGNRFALMVTKMTLAQLILNFTFKTCAKTPRELEFNPQAPILGPLSMWLEVEKL